MRLLLIPVMGLLLMAQTSSQQVSASDRLLHEEMMVLDTHLDTPSNFERPRWDFSRRNRWEWDGSQVDLPRMAEGGLDGGFFVIYTAQGELTPAGYAQGRDAALQRAAAIQRVIGQNSDRIGFATTAEDAERLNREGRAIGYNWRERA